MSAAVLTGTNKPHHADTSYPGTVSAIVGISGAAGERLAEVTAKQSGSNASHVGDEVVTLNRDDTHGAEARFVLEMKNRALNMRKTMAELDEARSNRDALGGSERGSLGFRVVNELLDRLRGRGVRHHHQVGYDRDQRDRCKIARRVVASRIEPRIDRETRPGQKHGVAVGRGLRDGLGPDVAASATFVFNNDLLAPQLRQSVRQRAAERIAAAAGWKRHDEAHVAAGIVLRACRRRPRRRDGGARGQT